MAAGKVGGGADDGSSASIVRRIFKTLTICCSCRAGSGRPAASVLGANILRRSSAFVARFISSIRRRRASHPSSHSVSPSSLAFNTTTAKPWKPAPPLPPFKSNIIVDDGELDYGGRTGLAEGRGGGRRRQAEADVPVVGTAVAGRVAVAEVVAVADGAADRLAARVRPAAAAAVRPVAARSGAAVRAGKVRVQVHRRCLRLSLPSMSPPKSTHSRTLSPQYWHSIH